MPDFFIITEYKFDYLTKSSTISIINCIFAVSFILTILI